ncbi:hypothetical protein KKB55_23070, partial [Myxococcota bacterium]|nr:hypothetical protein [Myxococcota bacterium]
LAFALGRLSTPRGEAGRLGRAWGIGLGAAALLVALGDWAQDQRYTAALDAQDPVEIEASARALRPTRRLQAAAALKIEADPQGAAALAARALAQTPSVEGWLLLGQARAALEDDQGAATAFKAALRLNPRSFAAAFNLAITYEALGDRFTARRYAARARGLRPSDPRLRDLPE